jgi:hypothetical protein
VNGQFHAVTTSLMGKEPHIHIEKATEWVLILTELFNP